MTGVNYISGSLNRSKAKTKHLLTDGPTRPRLRGQPLFARPAPTLLKVDKGIPVFYHDPAVHPLPSHEESHQDDRSAIDAYFILPSQTIKMSGGGGPNGQSGIDGIPYPWAQSCRDLYLEERALERWKLDRRFRPSDDGEEGEEGQMSKRTKWVHRASRAKRGEERRGRRRWWDTRVLDPRSEDGKQQGSSDRAGHIVKDPHGTGVYHDERQAMDGDEAQTGEEAKNAQDRIGQECAEFPYRDVSFNREDLWEEAMRDRSGLEGLADLSITYARSGRPNLDRERRILSAMIGQYDFLHIHGLQTSSTIPDDDGLSVVAASTCLTD